MPLPKNELRRYPLDAWLEPDSAIARRDAVRRLRAENLRSAAVPVQIRQGNGQAVPARVQVAQVLNADGEPHCVVHFFEKAPTTTLTPPPAARAHATAPSPSPPKHRTKAEAGASQEPVLVPLVRTNVNGRVREWSERATELFGIAAEVAQGQPLHLYFRPSDATAFYADLARLAAQEEAAHELSFFDSQKQRQFCKINVRASGGGGNDFELAEWTLTHEEDEAPQDEEIASSPDLMTNSHASPLAPEQWWPLADLPREKLLLSETHHRIKNHLQIISSLLNLECNAITDDAARAALRSSQNRVRAIAELHQHLYQVALGTMESFTQFAEGLVLRLRECYQIPEERVAVNLELQSVEIQPEWLMPLALTLNEALSNCFEHAFPMDRAGVVQVRLQLQANQGEMLVTDNGTGFPSDFVAAEATGLGLKILAVFAEQMRGQLLVGPSESGGSEIQLRFPIAHTDI